MYISTDRRVQYYDDRRKQLLFSFFNLEMYKVIVAKAEAVGSSGIDVNIFFEKMLLFAVERSHVLD